VYGFQNINIGNAFKNSKGVRGEPPSLKLRRLKGVRRQRLRGAGCRLQVAVPYITFALSYVLTPPGPSRERGCFLCFITRTHPPPTPPANAGQALSAEAKRGEIIVVRYYISVFYN